MKKFDELQDEMKAKKEEINEQSSQKFIDQMCLNRVLIKLLTDF